MYVLQHRQDTEAPKMSRFSTREQVSSLLPTLQQWLLPQLLLLLMFLTVLLVCWPAVRVAAQITLLKLTCSLQGDANTKEYRQFVQHEGKDVSAWHDIPLQNEDGSFNFVCEIPKETSAKMEVATVSVAVIPTYKYAARHSCDLFASWSSLIAWVLLCIMMAFSDATGISEDMIMHCTKVERQACFGATADLVVMICRKRSQIL